jgi:signal-transduction protein with cAMP-binding, CBS, and nucleotidyltransferase domain
MPIPDELIHPLRTVPFETPCGEAVRRMEDEHVGSLVVTRDGKPFAIVTDRDIALHVLAGGGSRDDAVEACASEPLVLVERSASVAQASRLLRRHRVRRLPVVDEDGTPVGMVAADDLIRQIGQHLSALGGAIRTELTGATGPGASGSRVYGSE